MRLRRVLAILGLVAAPAAIFAVAEASSSPRRIVAPGTAYLAKGNPGDTLQADVNRWLRAHPYGSCDVHNDTALCQAGDRNLLVVIVRTR